MKKKGITKCGSNSYTCARNLERKRKRKRQFDECRREDVLFDLREKFKVEVFFTINKETFRCLSSCARKVWLSLTFRTTFYSGNKSCSSKSSEEYPNDLEDCLDSELTQFVGIYKAVWKDSNTITNCPASKQESLIELRMFVLLNDIDWIQTFPNVNIALLIYLCKMVSNCSGERSFSKLKGISTSFGAQ